VRFVRRAAESRYPAGDSCADGCPTYCPSTPGSDGPASLSSMASVESAVVLFALLRLTNPNHLASFALE
jgi:hypothetical protein